jgi:hypothetical protein
VVEESRSARIDSQPEQNEADKDLSKNVIREESSGNHLEEHPTKYVCHRSPARFASMMYT